MASYAKDDSVGGSEWRHLMHGLLGVAWFVMAVLILRNGLHNIGFWLEDILSILNGDILADDPGIFILSDVFSMVPSIVMVAASIFFAVVFIRGRSWKLLSVACALYGSGYMLQSAIILLFHQYSDAGLFFRTVLVWLAKLICMCVLTVSWKHYRKQLKAAGVESIDGLFPFLKEFGLWWKKHEARVFEEPEA